MKQALNAGPTQRNAFRDKYLAVVIVVLVLFSSTAFGQNPTRDQLQRIGAQGYSNNSAEFRKLLYVPLDTLSTADSGAIAYVAGKFFMKTPQKWLPSGSGKQLNDSTFIVGGDTITIRLGNYVPLTRNITINGQAHTLATDPVWNLTKADIGLSNVDNTSDVNKPVSTAQQTALKDSVDLLRKESKIMHILIPLGQSNMRGRGSAGASPNPQPNTVYQYDANVFSMVTDEVGNLPAGYGSLLPTLGIRYYNLTGQKVCFVPCAVDGSAQTAIADIGTGNWSTTGTLYSASIIKINAAIAAVRAAGYTPVVKGFLWCQGETDVHAIEASTLTKAQYKSALQTMIANYRAAYGAQLPFYIWQTGYETGYNVTASKEIQDGQQEVCDADSLRTIMVSTNARTFFVRGLMSDAVHWNQTALNEQGLIGANKIASGEYKNLSWVGDDLFYMKKIGIGVQMPSAPLHVLAQGSTGGLFENLDTYGSYPIKMRSRYQQAKFIPTTPDGISGFTLSDYTEDGNKNVDFMYLAASKTLFLQVAPGMAEIGNQFVIQKNDSHRWFRMFTDQGIIQSGFMGTGIASTGVNDALQTFGSHYVLDTSKAMKGLMTPLLMLTPSTSGGTGAEGKVYFNSISKLFLGYNGTTWLDLGATGGGGGGGGLTNLNGQTGASQTFATPGTSGTDVNWSSASDIHTLNVPDASTTARGVVTTGTQSIGGAKTFIVDGSLSIQRATASNTLHGYSIKNNSGQEMGGVLGNMASGEIRQGAFRSTFFTTFYSSNSERARIMATGEFNINNTTNVRLGLFVNRSVGFRKDSITLVSSPAAMDLPLIDTTAGAEEGKIKRMKYVLDEYTPTLTNVANIDNSVAYTCFFKREGQYVTVQGQVEIDPTAAAACRLGISLPIASNFTASTNAHGLVNCISVQQGGGAEADPANDRVELVFPTTDLTQRVFKFSFTYKIL